jgi:hypothetical protein
VSSDLAIEALERIAAERRDDAVFAAYARSQIDALREQERQSRHVERALIDVAALAMLLPNVPRLEAARWVARIAAHIDEVDRKLQGRAREVARSILATQVETFEAIVLGALYSKGGE